MTEAEGKSSVKTADWVPAQVTDCGAAGTANCAADWVADVTDNDSVRAADCAAANLTDRTANCGAAGVAECASSAVERGNTDADCAAPAAALSPSSGRPTWDEYFMAIANLAATRSTCLRRQVGAVLVRDRHIIATGYNGAPEGLPHCLEVGCLRKDLQVPSGQRHEMCIGVHAEQNLLIQAALAGSSPEGATLYCTHQPCIICAKMLINARIKRVVFRGDYPDALSRQLLTQAGVELMQYSNR